MFRLFMQGNVKRLSDCFTAAVAVRETFKPFSTAITVLTEPFGSIMKMEREGCHAEKFLTINQVSI